MRGKCGDKRCERNTQKQTGGGGDLYTKERKKKQNCKQRRKTNMAEKAREILKQRRNKTKEIQRKRRKEREREGE